MEINEKSIDIHDNQKLVVVHSNGKRSTVTFGRWGVSKKLKNMALLNQGMKIKTQQSRILTI